MLQHRYCPHFLCERAEVKGNVANRKQGLDLTACVQTWYSAFALLLMTIKKLYEGSPPHPKKKIAKGKGRYVAETEEGEKAEVISFMLCGESGGSGKVEGMRELRIWLPQHQK